MIVQRMSDIVLATALLLLCLPALFLISLVLMMQHGQWPVVRSDRLVRGGRVVRLFHLRIAETTPFGARLTSAGALAQRFHLDHVPALINVLKGEVTLIGPEHDATASLRVLAERPFG